MKINLIIILIKIKDCIPLIAQNNNLFVEIKMLNKILQLRIIFLKIDIFYFHDKIIS